MATKAPESSTFYYTCNGKIVSSPEELRAARLSGVPVRAWPRLPGGKGGFGSLLRSIGSQIDKTTNREMCRDLSGRRMRDVNNQKRLAEWASGAGARAAERQKRREERRRRRRELLESADSPAGHVMEDGSYLVEKERLVDTVFGAVQEALKSRKRPADQPSTSAASAAAAATAGPSTAPKVARKKWLEADLEDLEGSSNSSSTSSSSSSSNASDAEDFGGSPNASNPPPPPPPPPSSASNGGSGTEASESSQPAPPADEAQQLPGGNKSDAMAATAGDQQQQQQQQAPESTDGVEPQLLDLAPVDSVEAAEQLGLDELKTQLRLRGLKCSGSLRERAQRLLAVRGLQPEQYPPALLAAAAPGKPQKQRKKKQQQN